jgi:Fe-S-cluster containining protein
MAVTICDQEAAKIQKATGIVPRKNVHQTFDRNAIVLQYVNTPCTFLKNGTCSIYEARPLACRLFWNISDYPHVCDTYNGHHNVPGLDMTPMHMLTVMIFAKSKFADIREFFPPNVE